MGVDYKPVDIEIDDHNTIIFYVFEMQIGMNEFDQGIFALLKLLQERPENSRPEPGFISVHH